MKRLFDADQHTGVIETFEKDMATGKVRLGKHQNTDAIFKANAEERNSHIDNNWRGDMHKVASVPLIIVDMWREELKAKGCHNCDPLHNDNRTFLIAKLNSSDFSSLRTKGGRI